MSSRSEILVLAGLVLLAQGPLGFCHADQPPQAMFVVKKGFMEITLVQEGKPVPEAALRILDEQGQSFADGETGKDGRGEFPQPPGSSFLLEIKIAGKTADPIRLHQHGEEVEPARVLLSYGLRPCCRSISRSKAIATAPQEETSPAPVSTTRPRWMEGLAGLFLMTGAMVLFLFRLPRSTESALPARDNDERTC